ncbi:MAG: ribonuclease R, partial [Roseomonas mucosa]|nr:ribonuclease R [Roseomonas mucosa]
MARRIAGTPGRPSLRVKLRRGAGPQASARRRAAAEPEAPASLPTREELRAFLRAAGGTVGKSQIVRHFGLGVEHRPALRALLKELRAEGSAAPSGRRSFRHAANLPESAIVEVFGTDPDGD